MNFRRLLEKDTPWYKCKTYKLKHNLASIALKESGTSEKPNECLFICLSHLAEVPELQVNINMYDNFQLYPKCFEFDKETFLLCREKVKELDELISKIIVEET